MNSTSDSKVSGRSVSLEDLVYGVKEELSDQVVCAKENSKKFIESYSESLSEYMFKMYLYPTANRKCVHSSLPDLNLNPENIGGMLGNITGATFLVVSSLYFLDRYGPKGILLTPVATNLASKAYEAGRKFVVSSYIRAKNRKSK